jgi:hypothetical protein
MGLGGSQGPKGPQGARGVVGAKGAKGEVGDTGIAGATGQAGATGYPGAAGANGETGSAGPAGSTGAAGGPGTSPDPVEYEKKLLQVVSQDIQNRVLDDTPKQKDPTSDLNGADDLAKTVKTRAEEVIKNKILVAVREELERIGVSHSLTRLRDEIWALKRRVAHSESYDDKTLEKYEDIAYLPQSGLLQAESEAEAKAEGGGSADSNNSNKARHNGNQLEAL